MYKKKKQEISIRKSTCALNNNIVSLCMVPHHQHHFITCNQFHHLTVITFQFRVSQQFCFPFFTFILLIIFSYYAAFNNRLAFNGMLIPSWSRTSSKSIPISMVYRNTSWRRKPVIHVFFNGNIHGIPVYHGH